MIQTTIKQIQEWYKSHCNGDWEHSYGVQIDTIDNPGWRIKIDLTDTDFENKDFNKKLENGDNDWYSIWTKNKTFEGCGDPDKLEIILNIFLDEFAL